MVCDAGGDQTPCGGVHRGVCDASGQCACHPGFFGLDCTETCPETELGVCNSEGRSASWLHIRIHQVLLQVIVVVLVSANARQDGMEQVVNHACSVHNKSPTLTSICTTAVPTMRPGYLACKKLLLTSFMWYVDHLFVLLDICCNYCIRAAVA